MTTIEVPVSLTAQPPDRPTWATGLIETLGDHAARDMSFTGGHPTIRWGVDETVWIRVEVEDPAAMDADSPEAAARTIVASALFDLELTSDDATILHDQTRIA